MADSDRAFRLTSEIEVEAAGSIVVAEEPPKFRLLDRAGSEFSPATDWLLQLWASDCSPHTVRAYAMSLLRYLRFLWAVDCDWDRATEVETRDFVLWARQAHKFVGRKRPPAPRTSINLVTGKRNLGPTYSASTINHTLSAVSEFYAFHHARGRGPVSSPVPTGRGGDRPFAHHRPDEDFESGRRRPLRQKQRQPTPRAIPDAKFDEVFRRLGSNRDRALVAMSVSSGARASELLGLTGERVNFGDQLVGVIRKGGDLQWIPAAPDAFIWLRLYQIERGVARHDQPVWLTRREPFRPLTYDALRAVLDRANRVLGTNWTTHDLRHTFSIRALDGGMALHELQVLLGHESLETTGVYTRPRPEDVIEHHRAAFASSPAPSAEPPSRIGYDSAELAVLFDQGRS